MLSEDEAGNQNEETTAVNKRQLVEIEDGDSDSESEFYGWLCNEVMNSRMEKNKTISKAAKGKKSPKRLVNRKSIRAFSKKPSSTPIRDSRPSTKKNSTDGGQFQAWVNRIYSLEDSVEKIQRTISDKAINTVFQEDLIKDLVNTAISESLKDLKQQHKNSLALLTHQVEGNKKYYEEELKKLNDELEKFRNKVAAANDKCNKMEKRIKDQEHSITLQKTLLRMKLIILKMRLLELKGLLMKKFILMLLAGDPMISIPMINKSIIQITL